MTNENKKLLLALTIGDGTVYQTSKNSFTYSCGHGDKQFFYIKYKADLLSEIFNKKVNIHTRNNVCSFTGKRHILHRVKVGNKYLRFIRRQLYHTGEKVITNQVLDRLSNKGLAIWYMDDGSLSKKKNKAGDYCANDMIFHTCCHEEEAKNILNWFENKFQISGTLKKEKKLFSIRFGTKSARILAEIMKPFILDGFYYKIDVKPL